MAAHIERQGLAIPRQLPPVKMPQPAQQSAQASGGAQFVKELTSSGIAVAVATAATNPIDVVKTRIQLARNVSGGLRSGMIGTSLSLVQHEGVFSVR